MAAVQQQLRGVRAPLNSAATLRQVAASMDLPLPVWAEVWLQHRATPLAALPYALRVR